MTALAIATLLFSRSATLATKYAKWSTCHLYLESHPKSVLSRITGPRQPGPRNLDQGCLSYSVRLLRRWRAAARRTFATLRSPNDGSIPPRNLACRLFGLHTIQMYGDLGVLPVPAVETRARAKVRKKWSISPTAASGAWLPSSLTA